MSTFYGTLQGNRGEATRQGSMGSGIRASAQSWNGSVITELRYDNDNLMVTIGLEDGSQSIIYRPTWYGTFDELRAALQRDMQQRAL